MNIVLFGIKDLQKSELIVRLASNIYVKPVNIFRIGDTERTYVYVYVYIPQFNCFDILGQVVEICN